MMPEWMMTDEDGKLKEANSKSNGDVIYSNLPKRAQKRIGQNQNAGYSYSNSIEVDRTLFN